MIVWHLIYEVSSAYFPTMVKTYLTVWCHVLDFYCFDRTDDSGVYLAYIQK